MPGVPYLGPPADNWGGRVVRPPMGMVVHIAEGTFQGTIAWQHNSISDVSSYFVTSRAGEVVQMLDLDLMAWTQGDGNAAWVGVENEGFHTEAFTDAQVDANARIFAWLRSVWPSIPAQVTNSPSVGGLGWHGMGGVAWGNHPDCPGPPNVALLPTILARAINNTEDEDMGASLGPIDILDDVTSLCIPPVEAGAADPRQAWLNVCNDTFGARYALRVFTSTGDQTWQPLIGAGVVNIESGERLSVQLKPGVAAITIKRMTAEGGSAPYEGPLTCCVERGPVIR